MSVDPFRQQPFGHRSVVSRTPDACVQPSYTSNPFLCIRSFFNVPSTLGVATSSFLLLYECMVWACVSIPSHLINGHVNHRPLSFYQDTHEITLMVYGRILSYFYFPGRANLLLIFILLQQFLNKTVLCK